MSIAESKAQGFKFQKNGDTLAGKLLDVYQTDIGGLCYEIENVKGRFWFFGSVQLNRMLEDQIGRVVSITYKGTRQTRNGYTMKVFEVISSEEASEELPSEIKEQRTT